MQPQRQVESVVSLLDELEGAEPTAWSLGTPELAEPEAVARLVAMGPAIVPELVGMLDGNVAKKRAAYVALVLGRIGDKRALAPLRRLRERYQARPSKDAWDYAAIGQSNLAITALERAAP